MLFKEPDERLVGLSLSFCVSDIVRGTVKLNEVGLIYAGTSFEGIRGFASVCKYYTQFYWREHKAKSIAVAAILWLTGRIEQPKLKGLPAPRIPHGHWTSESNYAAVVYTSLEYKYAIQPSDYVHYLDTYLEERNG